MAKRSKKKRADGGGVATKLPAARIVVGPPRSLFSNEWLLGLILVLAVFIAYSPVWRAGYIWDDDFHLTANPVIVGPQGLIDIWTTSVVKFCPLVFTTFWVEHVLWGLAPLPYHLVNVLLHGASAVLLWRVLLLLEIPGAWLGAALWALHPVQVESVAWISEMKNTESGLFFLLTLLFFVKGLKQREVTNLKTGNWNYGLTLLFAFLAMASKSSTVILPVVLGLVAWWIEGRWQWRNLKIIAPIFLLSVVASALTIWNPDPAQANEAQWVQTWPERLVTAGDAIWFYLGKLLWPDPLIVVYPRWAIDARQWYAYVPLLLVSFVSLVLWMKRKSWSHSYFLVWAYFIAALLPVLGLINMSYLRYAFVADHFQYLASMGPLALAGVGLTKLTGLAFPRNHLAQSSLYTCVLLILGVMSWQRAWVYESKQTLWTDTLAKNPSCWIGHNNLGADYLQNGQTDAALSHFQEALEIYPNFDEAHNNLGNALLIKGEVGEAMSHFQKALEINPRYQEADNDLGQAYQRSGRLDEAIAYYEKALALDSNYDQAHDNLGLAFVQKGRLDDAMAEFQKAIKANPEFAEAHNDLGNILLKQGQVDAAIDEFQKALAIKPALAEAHGALGVALSSKGQMNEAIGEFQKALDINPNLVAAHYRLGMALAQRGQLDEAIIQFQAVVRLNPGDANARDLLAKAQAMVRQRAGQK